MNEKVYIKDAIHADFNPSGAIKEAFLVSDRDNPEWTDCHGKWYQTYRSIPDGEGGMVTMYQNYLIDWEASE